MHFHLPKPLHGWREFFGEVGVVVLGILIALGGEQIVEKVHERIVAQEAREQVNQELATDFAVLGNRVRSEPCIARRIEDVMALLAVAGTSKYVAPSWISQPNDWDNQTGRWQAASQSGRAALLSQAEQITYSFAFSQIAALQAAQSDEAEQWAHLAALQGVANPSSGMIDAARVALVKARHDDRGITIRIAQSSRALRKLGIAPVRSPVIDTIPSICWPITLPTAEGYARLSG